jgi:hypothetical protein
MTQYTILECVLYQVPTLFRELIFKHDTGRQSYIKYSLDLSTLPVATSATTAYTALGEN